jgi:hypothetical protein
MENRPKDWVAEERSAAEEIPAVIEVLGRGLLGGAASPKELRRVREVLRAQGGAGRRQFVDQLIELLPKT